MSKNITVEDERGCQIVASECRRLLTEKGKLSVTIQDYDESIREAQRRLGWVWDTQISKARGWGPGPKTTHHYYKEMFAVPIFERDRPGFSSIMKAIHKIRYDEGFAEYRKILHQFIDECVSTKDLSVKQGREYLTSMELEAADHGIVLEKKEDLYQKAMGRFKEKPKQVKKCH